MKDDGFSACAVPVRQGAHCYRSRERQPFSAEHIDVNGRNWCDGAYTKLVRELQPQVPSYGLAEVFGLEEEENYFTWLAYESSSCQPFVGPYNREEHCSPEIKVFQPLETEFNAYGFLTPLRLTTAQSLGGWKDYCLAARNRFGAGEAYYFGTFLGLSIFNRRNGASQLIRHILAEKVTPKVKGQELRPRLVENGEEGLLAVFNNSRFQPYTESIAVPDKYGKATDIHLRKDVPVTGGRVSVTVPPEGVVVFHLA